MSNLAKLSRQALQLEHGRQFDKALALYARMFDEAGGAEDVDVALYNRAGDVAMRVGESTTATRYYERAIDGYAAGGLLNNAIAVCNKVLRYAPDHAATHYTLAVLHAKQGFRGDAKHHFVEYADRMHRGGRDDEALRALTEFAALCPPGDDVRAVLAQHLARGNRGAEHGIGLQALLETRAAAPAKPDVGAPPAPGAATADGRAANLVFLDISASDATVGAASDGADSAGAAGSNAVLGLELTTLAELPLDDAPSDLALELGDEPVDLEHADATFAFDSTSGFDASTSSADALPVGTADWDAPLGLEPPVLDEDATTELFDLTDAPSDDLAAFASDAALDFEPALASAPADDISSTVELPFMAVAFDEIEVPESTALVSSEEDASFDASWLDGSAPERVDADVAVPSMAARGDVGATDPRWTDALPSELPALSLGGWLGSANALVVGDDAPILADVAAPTPSVPSAVPSAPVGAGTARPAAADYVDLGDWLRADEPPPTTRLATDESTPTGDEAADFDRLLGIFRAGIARNIEVTDADSHYDLGVAFREMGLIDEAIAEFQKAAQAPRSALRAREALGQCFLDRGSPELAAATLERAMAERAPGEATDESRLLGVLYLLGEAHERLGRTAPARACFERVVANDIEFRDAVSRLTQLSASSP